MANLPKIPKDKEYLWDNDPYGGPDRPPIKDDDSWRSFAYSKISPSKLTDATQREKYEAYLKKHKIKL